MELEEIRKIAKEDIEKAGSLDELNQLYKKYLGKKGEIADVFNSLKKLDQKEKKETGKRANTLKEELEKLIEEKSKRLKAKQIEEITKKEKIDVTKPGAKVKPGHLHPLTQIQREVEEIFKTMGFSTIEGPEVESEHYNFDALNIPKDHPARDLWDTFWLKGKNSLLLRTHTSPVQIRYMEKNNPPLKIIVPGRVFRHEATDASHEIQFYQVEGLMVDEKVSATNFKAIIEEFLNRFFKTNVDIRLRPSFFPFTEPSFEIDIKRKGGEWLEMMGAGMVHKNVLNASGLNPKDWQGFAFGVGLDRLAMIRYNIKDIRLFYSGDLKFLEQF